MNKPKPQAIRSVIVSGSQSFQQKLGISDEDMGQLKTVAGVVLATLAAAGGVAVLAIAPNLVKALTLFQGTAFSGRNWTHSEKQQKVIKSLYYLKRSGLIQMQPMPGKKDLGVQVLPKGLQRLTQLLHKPPVASLEKLPRTWWLVAADIPTKTHERSAEIFRKSLKMSGFYWLQRTLWLYPHPPQPILEPLLKKLDLGRYVTLMEVCRLDREDLAAVRRHYKI